MTYLCHFNGESDFFNSTLTARLTWRQNDRCLGQTRGKKKDQELNYQLGTILVTKVIVY